MSKGMSWWWLRKDPRQQTQSCRCYMLLKSTDDQKAIEPKPEPVTITCLIFPASNPPWALPVLVFCKDWHTVSPSGRRQGGQVPFSHPLAQVLVMYCSREFLVTSCTPGRARQEAGQWGSWCGELGNRVQPVLFPHLRKRGDSFCVRLQASIILPICDEGLMQQFEL